MIGKLIAHADVNRALDLVYAGSCLYRLCRYWFGYTLFIVNTAESRCGTTE